MPDEIQCAFGYQGGWACVALAAVSYHWKTDSNLRSYNWNNYYSTSFFVKNIIRNLFFPVRKTKIVISYWLGPKFYVSPRYLFVVESKENITLVIMGSWERIKMSNLSCLTFYFLSYLGTYLLKL